MKLFFHHPLIILYSFSSSLKENILISLLLQLSLPSHNGSWLRRRYFVSQSSTTILSFIGLGRKEAPQEKPSNGSDSVSSDGSGDDSKPSSKPASVPDYLSHLLFVSPIDIDAATLPDVEDPTLLHLVLSDVDVNTGNSEILHWKKVQFEKPQFQPDSYVYGKTVLFSFEAKLIVTAFKLKPYFTHPQLEALLESGATNPMAQAEDKYGVSPPITSSWHSIRKGYKLIPLPENQTCYLAKKTGDGKTTVFQAVLIGERYHEMVAAIQSFQEASGAQAFSNLKAVSNASGTKYFLFHKVPCLRKVPCNKTRFVVSGNEGYCRGA